MFSMRAPEDCPERKYHGNPFRYCGSCSWVEEPATSAPFSSSELKKFRRFFLHRVTDPVGVSGTGIVALGAVLPDGSAMMRWTTSKASTVLWDNLDDLKAVHCHGGMTHLVFIDEEGAW